MTFQMREKNREREIDYGSQKGKICQISVVETPLQQ